MNPFLKEVAEDLVAKFENSENPDIFAAVANYYADEADPKRYDWFEKKMSQFSGLDLYRTMGTFGAYLVKSSLEIQAKSFPFLEKIALKDQQYYVRFMATQTLALMATGGEPHNQEVKKIIKNIAAKEKDPHLVKAYESLKDL